MNWQQLLKRIGSFFILTVMMTLLFMVGATNARPWLAILLLALIFALLENDTHLIPNPLMPSIVRQVHFIETASSNFLFGLIAGALLLWHSMLVIRLSA